MAYPVGIIRTRQGNHRLHESLFLAGTICASLVTAFISRLIRNVDLQAAKSTAFQCHQMDRYVVFSTDILDRALTNTIPDEIELRIEAQPGGRGEDAAWPLQEIMASAASLAFVRFYEDFRPVLHATLGNDHTEWPNPWRFGRVVRNAASHNAVHIDDKSFTPLSWHELTYGPAQNGRKIFGNDLAAGDILVLMLEMNDCLDKLGAPIKP